MTRTKTSSKHNSRSSNNRTRRSPREQHDWLTGGPESWRAAVALTLLSIIVISAVAAGFIGDAQFERQMDLAREALRTVALLAAGAGWARRSA